jgi:hypothetical protein
MECENTSGIFILQGCLRRGIMDFFYSGNLFSAIRVGPVYGSMLLVVSNAPH